MAASAQRILAFALSRLSPDRGGAALSLDSWSPCMLKLTWRQATSWRLTRHHLYKRATAKDMLAVASQLCGLHAQVMSCAELTLWARVNDLRRGAVSDALWRDRTLVKTWAMRGTLHLLPSSELPLWHGALWTSRRYLKPAQWLKNFGITMEELARFTDAIGVALDGCAMTREELMRQAGRIAGSETLATNVAASWGTILKPAAFEGHLCFAPSVGQRVRFTRPHTWLGEPLVKIDPQAATAAVTRRFLSTYGPATYRDLARWWGGAGVATARDWIAALNDEAVAVEVDGRPAWMLAADAKEIRQFGPIRSVRLLPGFDQYVVAASHHAGELLPGDFRARVYRPQGWISPVLLVNGFMRGTWRHETKRDRLQVLVEPFLETPAWVRREAEKETERLAVFYGCRLDFRCTN